MDARVSVGGCLLLLGCRCGEVPDCRAGQWRSLPTRVGGRVRATILAVLTLLTGGALASQTPPHVPITRFIEAISSDSQISARALSEIRAGWRDAYAALFIDLARVMRPARRLISPDELPSSPFSAGADDEGGRRRSPVPLTSNPGSPARRRLLQFLERQTGQRFGDDLDQWRTWVWSRGYAPHPDYAALKRAVYGAARPAHAGVLSRWREVGDSPRSD